MKLEQAVKILKDYVELDRSVRTDRVKSDFDKFCEEKCVAIETVLKEIKKER